MVGLEIDKETDSVTDRGADSVSLFWFASAERGGCGILCGMQDSRAQRYLALCQQAGLPPHLSQQSLFLWESGFEDPADLQQQETDFIRVYAAARAAVPSFIALLTSFGRVSGVVTASRPGGVKSLDRLVEKYSLTEELPLDLLAGKAVVPSLSEMYRVAALVKEHFDVRGFRDRVVQPRASGYRDLQFIVSVNEQLAEFKIIHATFDELDSYEHRLYEMRRSLEAKTQSVLTPGSPTLSAIEVLVLDNLIDVSAHLFQQAWKLVLQQEVEE